MIWQEFVSLPGNVFSLFVLAPTLRGSMANVPLGTARPSALIGVVYGTTFFTLGMTFSAAGAFVTGFTWSLVALLRSPHPFRRELGLAESPLPRPAGRLTTGPVRRTGARSARGP